MKTALDLLAIVFGADVFEVVFFRQKKFSAKEERFFCEGVELRDGELNVAPGGVQVSEV